MKEGSISYSKAVLEEDEYREMDSVDELKKTLEDNGAELGSNVRQSIKKRFTDLEEEDFKKVNAYRKAKKGWNLVNRNNEVRKTEKGFHTYTWEHDGTEYNFHGFVHGIPKVFPMSQEVWETLGQEMRGFIQDFEPVYTEERVPQMFPGVGNSIFGNLLMTELDDIEKTDASFPKTAYLVAPVALAAKYLSSSNEESQGRLPSIRRALNDTRYMGDAANSSYSSTLPLKLEMDYHRKFGNELSLKNHKRSIYMFEKAVEGSPPSADKVNIVTGLGHIPDFRHYSREIDKGSVPESLKIDTGGIDQEKW